MRVLMTTDTVGGVWTYSKDLTEGLLRGGSSVTLLSMGRSPSAEQAGWAAGMQARWARGFTFVPTEYKLEWMQDGGDCLERSADAVRSWARASGAELLHSNQFCYGALDLPIPKLVVAHSDVWSWWAACRGGVPEPTAWSETYRKTVTCGLRGADVVVAPTAWMAGQIPEQYGLRRAPQVIANGRSAGMWPGVEPERRMQAITCGRLWDEAKNLGLLGGLEGTMPILVAGEAAFENTAEVPQSVEWLGVLPGEDLERRFRESAVYLMTSKYEPFGLAAVEAALAGCAVVANDIASLREVWGDAAVYFERDSPASLTAVLRSLAANEERLQSMALAAGRRARERYSVERMTEGYAAVYGELLAGRDRRHVA